MSQINLIVGLGNPGLNYALIRHNYGAILIEKICEAYHLSIENESKFKGKLAKLKWKNRNVACLIPSTYMNLSGDSVLSYAKYFSILPTQILVVHDEIGLMPGQYRFKAGGGHGGHNGLRNIIQCLGNANFNRLKLGIGTCDSRQELSNYVLAKPKPLEEADLKFALNTCLSCLPSILDGSWPDVAKDLNQLKL